jgi:hypothetical protein
MKMYYLCLDVDGSHEVNLVYFERDGLRVVTKAGVVESRIFKSLVAVQRSTQRSYYRMGVYMNSTLKEAKKLIGKPTTDFVIEYEHRFLW